MDEILNKINSMTKYPSIPTYHFMGEKGRLREEVQVPFDLPVILREKVDGVNARIAKYPSGLYLIGSREELLYARGDIIGNPQLGIVDALKPIAARLPSCDVLTIFYLEVYGGTVTKGSKQYTGNKAVGWRLFDIATIPELDILKMPIEQIASWRDNGGQTFHCERDLREASSELSIPLAPLIGISSIPSTLEDTHAWMKSMITVTNAALDSGAVGRPEGIVARAPDRSKIAKLRFEDYERTLRKELNTKTDKV